MPILFISHLHSDTELASEIIALLCLSFNIIEDDIRCTSIEEHRYPGGVDFHFEIRDELDQVNLVLGVISPKTRYSPWQMFELGAAWGQKKLIPALSGLTHDSTEGPIESIIGFNLSLRSEIYGMIKDVAKSLKLTPRSTLEKSERVETHIHNIMDLSKKQPQPEDAISPLSLYQLHFSSDKLMDTGQVFQDFAVRGDGGSNVNAVHFLWADTYTNSKINAAISQEANTYFLRISYLNGERTQDQGEHARSWPANIKIKPMGDAAFQNFGQNGKLKYEQLTFYARSYQAEDRDLALSIRILDRRATYWEYAAPRRGGTPSQFKLSNKWEQFKINLSEGKFGLFDADGNTAVLRNDEYGRPSPDFTIVAGITFVVGSFTAGLEEPGLGSGTIDIKNISFE